MDVVKLRNKIILEALHGNIIKNDENLSPVSIDASDEVGVYEIPNNWKWITIKDLCKNLYAGGDKTDFFSKSKTKDLTIPVVANGKDNEGIIGYTNIATESDKCLTISGRGTIGYSVIRDYPFSPVVRVLVLKPKDEINLLFLKYACDCFVNQGKGTSIPQLTIPMIKDILLPIPPYNEQEKIVEKLNLLDELVSQLTCSYEKIQDSKNILKKVLFDKAIHATLVANNPSLPILNIKELEEDYCNKNKIRRDKKVTPIDESEIPYEIPNNWIWTKLGNLGIYKKGPFGSSLTKSMFVPDGNNSIKVYEQQNAIKKDWKLGNYFISKEKFESMKSFEVQSDDIIVSCAGTIGETYVVPKEARKGIINQALMKITLFDNEYRDFFLLYFDYVLKKEANEKGKGTAMKNIPPFDVLKNMYIPIPPIEEQKRIIIRLEEMIKLIEQL